MKKIVVMLFFISIAFSSFGSSTIYYEKVWDIDVDVGAKVIFDGTFLVNDSEQNVIYLGYDDGVEIRNDESQLTVHYEGIVPHNGFQIKANATIVTDYNNKLEYNPGFEVKPKQGTELTGYNSQMEDAVDSLVVESSIIETVVKFTEWVHKYIEYDLTYSELENSLEIFEIKKGVCTAYSHLFIAMSNSVGLKTRFVSGFVLSKGWEPHAWVEVYIPGTGWLSADPTFNEVGTLDSTHVKVAYGAESNDIYEEIHSIGDATVDFDSNARMTIVDFETKERDIEVEYGFNEKERKIIVTLENNEKFYKIIPYSFTVPESWGTIEKMHLVFEPYEKKEIEYPLNQELLAEGFEYNIPFKMMIYDHEYDDSIKITVLKEKKEKNPLECLPVFIIFSIMIMGFRNV